MIPLGRGFSCRHFIARVLRDRAPALGQRGPARHIWLVWLVIRLPTVPSGAHELVAADYWLLVLLRHVCFDLHRRLAVFLVDPDLFGCGLRQVDVPAFGVGAAVVNLYLH